MIVAQNLSIGYSGKTILNNINFSLEKGKLISLLGSNGIGKSTLLKTITNLIPALSGSVLIQGTNTNTIKPLEFAKLVSLVLTKTTISKELTVLELIKLGRQPYTNWLGIDTDEDKKAIELAIELCDVNHLINNKLSDLSDGQLQLALIARAIAQDTPCIVLDEPSTHLDLFHKAKLFKLLKKLCTVENKTILFSTHDLDLALQLSDEIIVIKNQTLYHNTTDGIIEAGLFNNFFDTEDIIFDKQLKIFRVV